MILNKEFHDYMQKAFMKAYSFPLHSTEWFWFLRSHEKEYKDFIAMFMAFDEL